MAAATINVDHFIELDRQSIRLQVIAGLLVVVLGILALSGMASKMISVGGPNVDLIDKGVGLVVTLTGIFPFNNCWSRWERIKTLQAIKLNPALLEPETLQKLLSQLYSKFLGV